MRLPQDFSGCFLLMKATDPIKTDRRDAERLAWSFRAAIVSTRLSLDESAI
jgi:hypothetical protein